MSELGAELRREWEAWISGLLLENIGHWLEDVAGLFDLAWYARHFLLELSSSVSVTYFCKIKREGTKHLGLKQLKELSLPAAVNFGVLFIAQCCWCAWLPVTCKDNSSLKNSDCLDKKGQLAHLFYPTSFSERLCHVSYQKDAAFQELYLGKYTYSFLANLCCGFEWFSPSAPTPHSQLFCSSNCTHLAVLIASFVLEGRQQEVQPSGIVSVVWSVDI